MNPETAVIESAVSLVQYILELQANNEVHPLKRIAEFMREGILAEVKLASGRAVRTRTSEDLHIDLLQ